MIRTTIRVPLFAAVVVCTTLILGGCARSQSVGTEPRSDAWDDFVEAFMTGYFTRHPLTGVNAGRHEFDGKLPSYDPDSIAAEIAWLKSMREQAEAFGTVGLDAPRQLEREYLIASLDGDLFWLEEAGWPFRSPAFYGALDPSVYVTRDYAPLAERMRAYTSHVSGIPAATERVRANLRTPLPRTYVTLGRIIFGGLASFLENDVPPIFASVDEADLRTDFQAANTAAVDALRELDRWFAELEASATDDFALGPELYARMLWTNERVDTPLQELRAIARADLARNLAALDEACAAFAPGKSREECMLQMAENKPEGGSLAAARRQMTELRQFILDKEIVSIPSDDRAVVKESPPHMRWNQAFADIPGPYEEEIESIYYISPPDPSWPPEEQRGYIPGEADLLAITVHEVWPGHFLQYLHANRSRSRFGQVFVGYAFSEGWAHYTEEMMVEEGLRAGDPEVKVGQLKEALLRNVRFIASLGLHTGDMTVAEAERLFREQAFQDPANARQQAARGTFDPAYLNYTMGKLMIMKLRDDWMAANGDEASLKAFHDRFLAFGGPPIPLVRRAMLGEGGALFRPVVQEGNP